MHQYQYFFFLLTISPVKTSKTLSSSVILLLLDISVMVGVCGFLLLAGGVLRPVAPFVGEDAGGAASAS